MLCSGIHLYTKTSRKPYFKRFLDMKKVHDNSIKITVDIWRRVRDSNPRYLRTQHFESKSKLVFSCPARMKPTFS